MSFSLRNFREKKIGIEVEETGSKEIDLSIFSAIRRAVQDKYQRKDPKLLKHNSERKKILRNTDF